MTIFQLLIYSSLSTFGTDGELLSASGRWDPREFYRERAVCESAGASEIGKPIHEFVMLPAGPRKVERHKCVPITVN